MIPTVGIVSVARSCDGYEEAAGALVYIGCLLRVAMLDAVELLTVFLRVQRDEVVVRARESCEAPTPNNNEKMTWELFQT